MSNLVKHAERELALLLKTTEAADGDTPVDDEGLTESLHADVLEMVKLLASHNHSGSTLQYAMQIFNALANQEPLTPLMDTPDEWRDISKESGKPPGTFLQNFRCSRVFKEINNGETKVFAIEGRVFRLPDKGLFTSEDSTVEVTAFPYNPARTIEEVNPIKELQALFSLSLESLVTILKLPGTIIEGIINGVHSVEHYDKIIADILTDQFLLPLTTENYMNRQGALIRAHQKENGVSTFMRGELHRLFDIAKK